MFRAGGLYYTLLVTNFLDSTQKVLALCFFISSFQLFKLKVLIEIQSKFQFISQLNYKKSVKYLFHHFSLIHER